MNEEQIHAINYQNIPSLRDNYYLYKHGFCIRCEKDRLVELATDRKKSSMAGFLSIEKNIGDENEKIKF